MTSDLVAAPVSRQPAPDQPAEAALSIDELGERIIGMAGRIAAATCRWLLLVADFDAREGCARSGLASTARWLTHCCGLSTRAARDHVRVARTLAAFPAVATAMSAGRLSYSHVRAISRVALVARRAPGCDLDGADKHDARTVADLIEVAEAGTVGQLETIVRGLRTVDDVESADGGAEPARPEEYARTGWTAASQWQLTARLDPERGALIDKALDTVAAAEGLSRVDALERIAEIALVVLNDAGRARDLRGDGRATVVVHLDATSAGLVSGAAPTPGERPPARIEHGPGLPRRVIDRLLCEGRLRTSLHRSDGSMFDLGRSQRVVSRRLFRALLARDGGCTHPGCRSRHGLEAHHVRHWVDGGPTDLGNLVLLCRRHHHTHHDGDFDVTATPDGTFVFRRSDGRVLEPHVDPSSWMSAVPDPTLAADVRTPRWTGTGERLDRHWAISVLAQRRYRVPTMVAA